MHGIGDTRFFSLVAPLYDVVMPPADGEAIAQGLRQADRSIERIVDLGGGTGRAAAAVAVPERLVVDVTRRMLHRARDRGLDAVLADGRSLPFGDDVTDGVLVVDALHHMPGQRTVLEEAARITRPGGAIVIREFDPTRLPGRTIEVGERMVRMNSTFLAPETLREMLEDVGFTASVTHHWIGYTAVGILPGER